jgi:hypothetical protein
VEGSKEGRKLSWLLYLKRLRIEGKAQFSHSRLQLGTPEVKHDYQPLYLDILF